MTYPGWMTRQVMMGTFGLGTWGLHPLPRATLALSSEGIVATPKGWGAWLFDLGPLTCRYSEIQRAEAIRPTGLNLLWGVVTRNGVRIDRGPWTTRLIFLSPWTPDILVGLREMGVTVETRPRRLGLHHLYGRG